MNYHSKGWNFFPRPFNLGGAEPPRHDFHRFLNYGWTATSEPYSSLLQTSAVWAAMQVSYWGEAGGTRWSSPCFTGEEMSA